MSTYESQSSKTIRGTQSFVGTMSWVWKHPLLVGLEILWRWLWGIPALWLTARTAKRILDQHPVDWTALQHASLLDPMHAAEVAGAIITVLAAPVTEALTWLLPLLMLTWVAAHTIGRTIVLHRIDAELIPRPATFLLLTLLRLVALALAFAVWWRSLLWSSTITIANPIAQGREPNLVGYCALLIIFSMGVFVLWGVVSWIFSIAPLLAVVRQLTAAQAIRESFRLGALRQKLVEINLVMGIVKITLIVLAMVFSATPLPFQSVATDSFLHTWWAGVTVAYLIASDFFHVARAVAYLQLYRRATG
ncbi:hypothetical protein FTW19_11105 [Terriglobus albidus]|uniref:Uncharacterized protein n=1 Tax=Terriglobus albidus TaxID=1592106 RepID=A0A5B9ECQ5_9BACT|nr:hypothetical protein [Terriglobus albidus]QEE28500.1 hypothetical protein FTW19_11105 [Terriglobus albidus]